MDIPAAQLESVFDALPDVVFFVKDEQGRYRYANRTLCRRLGLERRDQVIGRRADELFPQRLGGAYAAQDLRVLRGESIENQLEVHLFANRAPGWCLTCKQPLREGGRIRGLIGVSRDLAQPDAGDPTYERLRRVLAHMQKHYADALRMATLARLAGLSLSQLERHFRRVFQLSPQQMLTRLRIDAAMRLLRTDASIASVGQACGFADQSAFGRQFKATVGMTPGAYRRISAWRAPNFA
jgi:PAS domain S-box-containing protein